VPAAAVIPWELLNVFGIDSYIISLIDLFWWLLGEIFIIEEQSAQDGSVLSSAPGPKCNRTAPVFIQERAVQILVVE